MSIHLWSLHNSYIFDNLDVKHFATVTSQQLTNSFQQLSESLLVDETVKSNNNNINNNIDKYNLNYQQFGLFIHSFINLYFNNVCDYFYIGWN